MCVCVCVCVCLGPLFALKKNPKGENDVNHTKHTKD